MDDMQSDIMEELILAGALQVAGIDSETGELLYQFTEKIKDISPDLYEEHNRHVNNELMKLWEKGFVDIDMTSDNPIVALNDKAFDPEALSTLSKENIWALDEIKRLMQDKEF
jgi:hypothetical protein